MLILVTGSCGFVGRRVIKAFTQAGQTVRALVRTPAAIIQEPGVEMAYGDVVDMGTLDTAMEGVQGVVHLVGIIREVGQHTFQSVNHHGTVNVLGAARRAGVSHFLHMSAIGAADDRRFPYLHSKWQGEQAVVGGDVPYTILRGSILFGEGDEFFNTLAAVVKASPVVLVPGTGKTRFQPMSVNDMADCVVRVFQDTTAYKNRLIEVGGPHHFTYDQLLNMIQQILATWRPRVHMPLSVMRVLLGVQEALVSHPPATSAMLDMLAVDNITQLDVVERKFGFTPRPVRGNIGYISHLTYWDSVRTFLGFMSERVRDH